MNKRQKPILLITILTICIGVIGAFNFATSQPHNPQQEAPEPAKSDVKVGDSRAAESQASTAAQVKAQMAGAKKVAVTEDPGAEGAPGSGRPSLEAPQMTFPKPKPNEAQTTSQWYKK